MDCGPAMDNKGKFRLASRAATSMETNQLGFHNLPFLAHRKSVKRGFEFTLMVVGKFFFSCSEDKLIW